MKENEISGLVLDLGIAIHRELGPGLLESIYESILAYELERSGIFIERQVSIPVLWKGILLENSYRADIIAERKVLIELTSVERLDLVHRKQVLTYLRVSGLRLGFLANFGASFFKDGYERIVNGLD